MVPTESFTWPDAPARRTCVVAEMACAHGGSVERALEIARGACAAGVDAVQLQLFRADTLVSPRLEAHAQARELELAPDDWRQVIHLIREHGARCWINPFDERSLEFALEAGADTLKLHSTDLSNPRMLSLAGAAGVPLSLAVGGSTIDEIATAVERLSAAGASRMVLMHGFQAYPTAPSDCRLRFMSSLSQLFGLPVGYQDHTDGGDPLATVLPAVAVGMGAVVIEKHVTDRRELRGVDWQSSLDAADFAEFVRTMRAVDEALGATTYRAPSGAELDYRRRMKKSTVVGRRLDAGHVLGPDDLMFVRSSPGGLSPSAGAQLLGRTLRVSLGAYENLQLEHVTDEVQE